MVYKYHILFPYIFHYIHMLGYTLLSFTIREGVQKTYSCGHDITFKFLIFCYFNIYNLYISMKYIIFLLVLLWEEYTKCYTKYKKYEREDSYGFHPRVSFNNLYKMFILFFTKVLVLIQTKFLDLINWYGGSHLGKTP